MTTGTEEAEVDKDAQLSASIDRWKMALTALGAAAIGAYFTYFTLVVGLAAAEDPDKWGTFGDFFGGLMNPIVAFAAFYWLTQSVKLQKQELADTREELRAAAEAQRQLVENGVLTARLSALAALANAAHDDLESNRSIQESIVAGVPTDSRVAEMEYLGTHNPILERITARSQQKRDQRDGYLKEMEELLASIRRKEAPL